VPAYTKHNLKEIENQGVHFGLNPEEMQLRMAKDPLECANCGITYLSLGPGYRAPFGHRHNEQEEIYILVSGNARLKAGDDVLDLEPFHAVRLPPETMRSYEGGPQGAELIVIGAPKTGPGDGDIEQGWWSD
jgi:mannose-6-phosphate isomerase-like protein (cupin superfamily)